MTQRPQAPPRTDPAGRSRAIRLWFLRRRASPAGRRPGACANGLMRVVGRVDFTQVGRPSKGFSARLSGAVIAARATPPARISPRPGRGDREPFGHIRPELNPGLLGVVLVVEPLCGGQKRTGASALGASRLLYMAHCPHPSKPWGGRIHQPPEWPAVYAVPPPGQGVNLTNFKSFRAILAPAGP
jgi:hypothetical protein